MIACPACDEPIPASVVGPCEDCAGNDRTFTFEELDDRAKEVVRQWARSWAADDFEDYPLEEAVRFAKILGIEIGMTDRRTMSGGTVKYPGVNWSVHGGQGDGACFFGDYAYEPNASANMREEAPLDEELLRIADGLTTLQVAAKLQYASFLRASISTGRRGEHSGCMQCEISLPDDNGDPLIQIEDFQATEERLTKLLRDFADWIHSQLEAEYDSRMEDEYVDELIIGNDYRFDGEGALV